jgi:hypothetical protein
MKSKIVFHQIDAGGKVIYRVASLTQRTEPKIGTDLSKSEVDVHCSNRNVTVEIKPNPKK